MDGDPSPALTGRRRTRPTSIGCRNPWQPKPGRAPLILAHAAVQTNRATSTSSGARLSCPRFLWTPYCPEKLEDEQRGLARKHEVVLRLLRGEPVEAVSR